MNRIRYKIFSFKMITLSCRVVEQVLHLWIKIIANKLRKFLSKGPKYRKNRIVDYQKSKENIITGINSCIQSCRNKHDVSISSFSDDVVKELQYQHLMKKLAISQQKKQQKKLK